MLIKCLFPFPNIVSIVFFPNHILFSTALESLGFASYITEVKDVLQECKTVALKRRKANSRLENLGIPEEELLRQQQELFAKVRIKSHNLVNQTDRCQVTCLLPVLRIKTDNLFDSDYFLPHLCTLIDHLH